MPLPWPRRPRQRSRAFTIIEMLTVIAIIGILMAILIPTVTGSSKNAKRAKTKVQFSQWAVALEGFRQEYGFYPSFAFSDGKIDTINDTAMFVQTLTGRHHVDGSALGNTDPGVVAGNTKRIAFCTFGSGDLTGGASPLLQDAFGNTQFVVLFDRNQDGMIRVNTSQPASDDYTSSTMPPSVVGVGNQTVSSPAPAGTIIRAGVAIYSAGDGDQPVKSW